MPLQILIADDSSDDRAEIRRLLLQRSDRTFTFTESETGTAAVRSVRAMSPGVPDCVLLDYALPDMDAPEVIAELLDADGAPVCPIVVITGGVETEAGRAVLRAGAQDYIGKDWLTPQGLIRAIENAAERWGMTRDLREKEAALRADEARFRLIFASAAVGIAALTPDGRFVEVNSAFCRIHGYERRELLGLTMRQLTHPEDFEADRACIQQLLNGERQTFTLEKRKFHKSGATIWVNHAVSLERRSDGEPARLVTAVHDITDQKSAEQRLAETNRRLQTLMDSLPVGVSFSEDATCERITGNPAVLAQFAVSPLDNLSASAPDPTAPGRQVRFFQDGRPVSDAELPLQRAVAENRVIPPVELEVLLPDGRRWFAAASAAPLRDAQGAAVAGVAVTLDVTARKRAEDEVRALNATLERRVADRTAQLSAANKELESFSYSVSHDMRAPLRGIDGFARVLVQEYSSLLPADARDCLQEICSNAKQMGRLIDDLLAFSRLTRQNLEKTIVATTALARECAAELCKGCPAEFRIADLPPCAADPALLKQVLLNLLGNALKYSRSRTPPVIEIGGDSRPNEMVYYVRDNGVGFDMRYAHKLFEVFQRLHRQEDYEGTGVGLAIVQRVVSRHGGRVWAESQIGHGATFYFSLPQEGGGGRMTGAVEILLVEDNKTDAKLALRAFERHNLANRVHVIRDGAEALEYVFCTDRYADRKGRDQPKVILLDLKLPLVDGHEVLRRLKSDPDTQAIPVVIMTSSDEERDLVESYKLGVNSYVRKPVDFEQFTEIVRHLGFYWLLINKVPYSE